MVNNCLIYAIPRAAGREPTRDEIYALRVRLRKMAGETFGSMLDITQGTVGIIMNYFGLTGTVNLYTVAAEDITDHVAVGHGHKVYNIYYANRHFTPHGS